MQDNVGTIVIGTKVNTKGATKDITKLYEQIEREQDKIERLTERKQQLDIDASKYGAKIDFAMQKTDELGQKIEEIAKSQLEIDNMPINPENIEKAKKYLMSLDLSDTASAKQYQDYMRAEQLQEVVAEFDKYVNQIDEGNAKLDILEKKQSRITKEIQRSTATQEELNQKLSEATGERGKGFNIAGFEKGLGKVSDKFSAMLKKVGKIALALVGVRTIINLITRSFNMLSQYNTELGTKMEQMRLVLAVALEPVINWLVSMLHTILSLINQISVALSGINLFGRASELWSKKMSENMGSGASSVKEMKKQLAGFDEMNVLTDNQASGGGGSNIQPWTLQPEFDWSKFDIHVLMDKAKEMVSNLIKGINTWLENVDPQELADGISTLIKGLLDIATMTFTEIDWQQLGKVLVETLSKMDWVGIIQSLINNIIGSLTWPIDLLIGLIDGLVDFFESPDCLNKMVEAGITLVVALAKGLWTLITKIFELGVKLISLFNDILWKIAEKLTEWTLKIWNWLKGVFQTAWSWITNLFKNIVQWIKDRIQEISNFFNKIITGIQNVIGNVVNWIINKFNIVVNFFKSVGVAIGDFFSGAIKGAVNSVFSWVEDKINWFIRAINKITGKISDMIPGVSISKISTISLPRLAVGGIINQPGRGVPVGGAIAGESGREGILPLTDKQAMAELGKEIGKWININATIPVNIGNRQVARVIQEINNDREFAMNS